MFWMAIVTVILIILGVIVVVMGKQKSETVFADYCQKIEGITATYVFKEMGTLWNVALIVDKPQNKSCVIFKCNVPPTLPPQKYFIDNFSPEYGAWYEHSFFEDGDYKKNNVLTFRGLAVDSYNKTIALFDSFYNYKLISFEDVVKIELVEHKKQVSKSISSTTTSTNRGSQIGGAVLGGVVFGGIGALIGGLSGSKTSKGSITTEINEETIYEFRLIVNDLNNPAYCKLFHKLGDALKVEGVFEKIIKETNENTTLPSEQKFISENNTLPTGKESAKSNHIGVADELIKLTQLKNNGDISGEEYEKLKASLIG